MSTGNPNYGALRGDTISEQAKKRHAEGQLFGNGVLQCAPSEEEVFGELVEDAPSLAPMAEDDVADFDDVQDDEEGEFDEAAAMREERRPLQDLAFLRTGSPVPWTVRSAARCERGARS